MPCCEFAPQLLFKGNGRLAAAGTASAMAGCNLVGLSSHWSHGLCRRDHSETVIGWKSHNVTQLCRGESSAHQEAVELSILGVKSFSLGWAVPYLEVGSDSKGHCSILKLFFFDVPSACPIDSCLAGRRTAWTPRFTDSACCSFQIISASTWVTVDIGERTTSN